MRWTTRRAMLALIGANVLWAGTYTAGKEALATISPLQLNALRFTLAGLALLPLLWRGRRQLRIRPGDLPRLIPLCLVGFVLNKQAEYSGLSMTTASENALLIAGESLCTAVLAWLVLREPVRRASLAGLLIGALGVYMVIEHGLRLPSTRGIHLAGDLLILLALVFEASYTVFGKAALDRFPGLLITAAAIIGSLVVWVPVGLFDLARHGPPHPNGAAWAGVLYMALAATVAAYLIWMVALRYVEASRAATTLYLQPLLGTVLAILVLGERPAWSTLAGGLCIIGGVWFAGRGASGAEARAAVEAEALAG